MPTQQWSARAALLHGLKLDRRAIRSIIPWGVADASLTLAFMNLDQAHRESGLIGFVGPWLKFLAFCVIFYMAVSQALRLDSPSTEVKPASLGHAGRFWSFIGVNLFTGLVIGLWTLLASVVIAGLAVVVLGAPIIHAPLVKQLAVVGGFIVFLVGFSKYAIAPWIVIDQDVTSWQAMRDSATLSKGQRRRLALLSMLYLIPYVVLGLHVPFVSSAWCISPAQGLMFVVWISALSYAYRKLALRS